MPRNAIVQRIALQKNSEIGGKSVEGGGDQATTTCHGECVSPTKRSRMPGVSGRGGSTKVSLNTICQVSTAAPSSEMPGKPRRPRKTKAVVNARHELSARAPISEIGGVTAEGGGDQIQTECQSRPVSPVEKSRMPGATRRGGSTNLWMSATHPMSDAAINSEMPGKSRRARKPIKGLSASNNMAPGATISDPGISDAGGGGDQDAAECLWHLVSPAYTDTVILIREHYRTRKFLLKTELGIKRRAVAYCMGFVDEAIRDDRGKAEKEAQRIYDAACGKGSHPFSDHALAGLLSSIAASAEVERSRARLDRRLEKLAAELPVADFVMGCRGVGMLSLAQIIGEAGDLSNYATHQRLWKRMGLAVMPDGKRQRRVSGVDAIEHGYVAERRSVMWNVGGCILRAGGPLKEAYDARKVIELARCEAIAADPELRSQAGIVGGYAPKAHAHNRAIRYVTKGFLMTLLAEWKRTTGAGDLSGSEGGARAPDY